jgi:hypothetical protein
MAATMQAAIQAALETAGLDPSWLPPTPQPDLEPDIVFDEREIPTRSPGRRPLTPLPIAVDEIEPGLVARLDPRMLGADARVMNTQDPPVTRAGLFICVEVEDELSTWAGVTTTWRDRRLPLRPAWRSGGYRRWRLTPQYLTDGASLWRGPNDAFSEASWSELSSTGGRNRARLDGEGLRAVRIEIRRQTGRRHRTWEAD